MRSQRWALVQLALGSAFLLASCGGGENHPLDSGTEQGAAAGAVPGVIERASVANDGSQATNSSTDRILESALPSISQDGRYVAFQSDATNLVEANATPRQDIYVRDTCAGATACTKSTVRVSVGLNGAEPDGESFEPSISADGRYVAFTSFASNLVVNDNNGVHDSFVRDTCIGATPGCVPSTERVSLANDGSEIDFGSTAPVLNADARYVVFESGNVVAGDGNGIGDVFVRDTCRGAVSCMPSTTRVSVATDGTEADGFNIGLMHSVSADGRYIAFHSNASNLGPVPNPNFSMNAYVRDTCTGASSGCTPSTTRVSLAHDGSAADGPSGDPSVTADGRFVAFKSFATNLVNNDTNNFGDIFVYDSCAGASGCTPSTRRVSVASNGSEGIGGESSTPRISAGGRFIAFSSFATNLVADDTNNQNEQGQDIFVRDTCTGATNCTPSTIRISVKTDGTQANHSSTNPAISANGAYVAFQSFADNLVANDTNQAEDVFLASTH